IRPLISGLVGADHQLPQVPADPVLVEQWKDLVWLAMIGPAEGFGYHDRSAERLGRLDQSLRKLASKKPGRVSRARIVTSGSSRVLQEPPPRIATRPACRSSS